MPTRRTVAFFGDGRAWLAILVLLGTPACVKRGGIDMAPRYRPPEFVVPDDWEGASPFVIAHARDAELRPDWWTDFGDPVLDELEAQAMAANPDLEAAAERFVQARDSMMMTRSRLIPQLGVGLDITDNRQSNHTLFRGIGEPSREGSINLFGLASWEPDFWNRIRNATRSQIYAAQEQAALWASARLSIQAELASQYYTLRGLDAKNAIYTQSVAYYQRSLEMVETKFRGQLASALDVARARYMVSTARAEQLAIQADRAVAEHAIAVLVNRAAPGFSIAPVDEITIPVMLVPSQVPSSLLERRPDVAAMEREMAQANRGIGIARAAFFPRINIPGSLGLEAPPASFAELGSAHWSYGALIHIPIFEGGYLRAQLQQSWSVYRETEDRYRSTVLNAFREVMNELSRTQYFALELERRNAAADAAREMQNLSMQLFVGALGSSLDLLFAQVNTLQSRLAVVDVSASLLKAIVALIRALGGGWSRTDLPSDDAIQPFGVFQFWDLRRPHPEGGIDVDLERSHQDLTRPAAPAQPSPGR